MSKSTNIAQISNPFLEAFTRNNDLVSFKVLLYIAKSKFDDVVNIDDINNLEDKSTYKVSIDMVGVSKFLDLDIRTIRKSISKVNSTSINYRRIVDGKDKETFINLLPAGVINYTDSTLDVWLFGEILKQIYATSKYSYIQTKNFIKLSSKHSIRMLLLLERIANYGKIVTHTDPETQKQINSFYIEFKLL